METAEGIRPGGESTHSLACPRIPVAKLYNDQVRVIPVKYIEALEQNQKIASCCRHPENHEIEAWYSSHADRDRGIPDIYIFICTCGRKHRRFCVGGSIGSGPNAKPDHRPVWERR